MNLFDLTEQEHTTYTKTIRILVYPNITFSKDLLKDSFIQVIHNQIRLLNQVRNDLYWYVIVPEYLDYLAFPNVTQYIMEFPTYPPLMRSHFDVMKFQQRMSPKIDIDLVMSHLPEHTHAIVNVLYNGTHHMPPVFGYCHWFDLKEIVAWSKDLSLIHI